MAPRIPSSWDSAIRSFTRALRSSGNYSPRTVRFYKEHTELVGKRLSAIYGEILPHQIKKEHITELLKTMRADGLAVSTQKNYIVSLKRLCEHYNNFVFSKINIVWPQDTRPNVDWLTPDQAKAVIESDLTPLERMIITLELCMGLRRIEVIRLKTSDVKNGYIDVTGKGRAGGKLRSVPFHPNFYKALDLWLSERDSIISTIKDPLFISESLLGYKKGRYFLPFSDVKATGIDKHIKNVSRKVGFPIANHTLRRTFGRTMWLSGVSVVTIAKLLGHKSTEQTLLYIGANLDDMAQAMAVFKF